MNNAHQPAFGFVDNRSNSYEDNEVHYGLTKREYFAANAGSPPDWFEHTKEEKNITKIPDYRDIEDKEHRNICEIWLRDGCFDLPEELQWFSDAYEKRNKEEIAYRNRDTISRYFQWKTYYADNILKQLAL